MLVYGLRIGSIVQWEATPGTDRVGHVQPGKLSHQRGQIDQGRTGLRGTGKNQGTPRAASANQG